MISYFVTNLMKTFKFFHVLGFLPPWLSLWYDVRTKLRIFFCISKYLRSTFAV